MDRTRRTFTDNFPAFTQALVHDYFDARTPVSKDAKLSRGTSRVVSALAEERFAELLVRTYPAIEHIYIDQRMNVKGARIRKPDLAVVVGGEVRLLVDVKMDLNWGRDKLAGFVEAAQGWLSEIGRGGFQFSMDARVRESLRKERSVPVSRTCKFLILLVAGDNVRSSGPGPKKSRVSVVELWPMKCHPNHPKDWTRGQTVEELAATVRRESIAKLQTLCDRVLMTA